MKKTRLWSSMLAAVALAVHAFGFGVPASASSDSGAITDLGNGTVKVEYSVASPTSNRVYICALSPCGIATYTYVLGQIPAAPMPASGGVIQAGDAVLIPPLTTEPLPAGNYFMTLQNGLSVLAANISVTIGAGGGGGGGASSGTAANTPVEVSLSLDLGASGASCTEGSAATGTTGSWLKLPGAGDCSSKTEPKATLLGWATTADFPVEIAQRQIKNGWGAYEMFDSEGRMTAVFIPAGQATFVSGPNSLHPVWAK